MFKEFDLLKNCQISLFGEANEFCLSVLSYINFLKNLILKASLNHIADRKSLWAITIVSL